jgi:hypothetical protein
MANHAVAATRLTPDFVATNLTALLATATGDGTASVAIPAGDAAVFPNTGTSFLAVLNGSGSGTTASVAVGPGPLGIATASQTVDLNASATDLLGPFHSALVQPSTGDVQITFSAAVTVALLQLPGVY